MRAEDLWLADLTGFPFALLRDPPRGCSVGYTVKSVPAHGDSHGVRGKGVQQGTWTWASSVGCSGGFLQVDIFVRGFVLFLAAAICPLSLLEAVTELRA